MVSFKSSLNVTAPPSDFELMSSMMQKISQLERKVKTQAVDIEHKARRIAVLEEKLNLLQKAKEKSASNENQDEELVQLCLKLQNQVLEMEKFLNDYGMIWIGGYDEHADSQLPPVTCTRKSFKMNYDLVMQNIQDLNIVAGEGESHVTAIPGGAKLTQKSSIPLWLYKNGIVMFSGPFRSYQEPTTQECMQDLMDGFFPSELQERFPNGVPLQVHDKRDEEFVVRRPWSEFPGRGQTIDGARRQSVDRSEQTFSTASKQSQIPGLNRFDNVLLLYYCTLHLGFESIFLGKKLSMEQFLQKLPETVVKAGKVISIRDSVKAHLQGVPDGAKSYSATTVETSALREREIDLTQSAKDVTTLRVKSEDGMETFIMKMYFTETVGDLRHYLDMKRGPGAAPYDIISAFPQRCYSDDTQTLLSCGLTPNAALLLRPQAASHRQNNA
ncbi:hypothetical protein PO909_009733 [Leuciscus waleckii]